jgi:imidazolonepropionase-like amidohydrolase
VTEGLVLPAFCDSHVHLGLVDPAALVPGGIGRVLDLGWDPVVASGWASAHPSLEVAIAGPLLAAPGGYPSTAGWAPPAATRDVQDAAAAAVAIAELVAGGSRVAKITLNAEAGPVWDDELLATVVSLAHGAELPVVAHAQGAGQAARALEAGVDALAHTPWTETLSDDLLRRMVGRLAWISTLDIHGWGSYGADYARAVGNLERFAALGGTVHYGTDLGNGPLPVGLNLRELAALEGAGLGIRALVASLGGFVPGTGSSVIAGAETIDELTLGDLLTATVVPREIA